MEHGLERRHDHRRVGIGQQVEEVVPEEVVVGRLACTAAAADGSVPECGALLAGRPAPLPVSLRTVRLQQPLVDVYVRVIGSLAAECRCGRVDFVDGCEFPPFFSASECHRWRGGGGAGRTGGASSGRYAADAQNSKP